MLKKLFLFLTVSWLACLAGGPLLAKMLTRIPVAYLDREFVYSAQVEAVNRPLMLGKIRVCRGLQVFQPQLTHLRVVNDSLCIQGVDERRKPSAVMLPIAKRTRQYLLVDLKPFFEYLQPGVDLCAQGKLKQQNQLNLVSAKLMRPDMEHLEARMEYGLDTDSGYFELAVRKSITLLPETPMAGREVDERLNFRSENRQFIDRFDLDRHKQITFVVDDAFPPLWQEAICQGIEDWNLAFEAMGKGKVMRALTFAEARREDRSFDPFRFGTNVFFHVDSEFANAEGKHFCDPRSGEILAAQVLFYSRVIEKLQQWYFLQTAAYNPLARGPLNDSITQRIIRYAAAHEVGHCLGLEHNFRASYAYVTDSLRSPAFCQEFGTTPSIMDYARFNYVAQPGDGVTQVCPPLLGVYDMYAIAAGYGTFASNEEFHAFVTEHQNNPLYLYQREKHGASYEQNLPEVQHSDLGNDVVASTRYGLQNLRYIDKHVTEWSGNAMNRYEGMPVTHDDLVKYYFELLKHLLPSREVPEARALLEEELADGFRYLLHAGEYALMNPALLPENAETMRQHGEVYDCFMRREQMPVGLWLPHQLASAELFEKLQRQGLQLSADEIQNLNEACLNNAMLSVSQDGGTFMPSASAAFISSEGLVLTNFHVVRRYLQQISTGQRDYVRDGCFAASREQEAPLFGLQLNQLLWCRDVTDTLMAGLPQHLSIAERNALLAKRAEAYMDSLPKGAKEAYRAYAMMGGNQYVVAKYRLFNDVRVVATPPLSQGMEGGDEMNWRWPRVSADYAVLRVYASASNKPANYKKTNVPYRPERFLQVADAPLQTNDLVLVAGFPAQTRKHIPWFALERIVNADTRFVMEVTEAKMNFLKRQLADVRLTMLADQSDFATRAQKDSVQALYAMRMEALKARISSLNNTFLKAQGEVQGAQRSLLVERRRHEDNALREWITAAGLETTYGASLLDDMQQNYAALTRFNHMDEVFTHCVLNGPLVFPFAGKFEKLIRMDESQRKTRVKDMERELKDVRRNVREFLDAFDYDEDLGLLKLLLPFYLREMDANYLQEEVKDEVDVERLFRQSILTDSTRLLAFVEGAVTKGTSALKEDALYQFCLSFYRNRVLRLTRDAAPFRRRNAELYNVYMTAYNAFYKGALMDLDANRTLRYSPGRVLALSQKPGVPVPCCFLANAETAPGNSGSAVLNARGELVGVNFDRDMQGLASVYRSNPDTNRNISVNVQYILWLLQQSPARYVVEEMKNGK